MFKHKAISYMPKNWNSWLYEIYVGAKINTGVWGINLELKYYTKWGLCFHLYLLCAEVYFGISKRD